MQKKDSMILFCFLSKTQPGIRAGRGAAAEGFAHVERRDHQIKPSKVEFFLAGAPRREISKLLLTKAIRKAIRKYGNLQKGKKTGFHGLRCHSLQVYFSAQRKPGFFLAVRVSADFVNYPS
jgi:hypothetical protein